MDSIEQGKTVVARAVAINIGLAMIKVSAGILGNSYALVADGIESTSDIFSSLIVLSGLRLSARPADSSHPYGHGKAESLAGLAVSLFLLAAAIIIGVQAINEIANPHGAPSWFTLPILGVIILIKEWLYRRMHRVGARLGSSSMQGDAWHHRSDAITSLAAFVGIGVALVGGTGYESADDWAALIACAFIMTNGLRLVRPALDEIMDATAPPQIQVQVVRIAGSVDGVVAIEKCRIRKSGLEYLMDLHVEVDPKISVEAGHAIGHLVKDRLLASAIPIADVIIHVEPASSPAMADSDGKI